MRANEFINEEIDLGASGILAKVADEEAAKKAKLRQKNIPRIAKLIHKNLESKMSLLFKKHQEQPYDDLGSEIVKMIVQTLSQSTKTDVTKNKEVFGNSVETLIKNISDNLDSFSTSDEILNGITDIVTKSFEAETIGADKAALSKKISDLLAKGASAEEIADTLEKDGMSAQGAEEVATAYADEKSKVEPEPEPDTVQDLINLIKDEMLYTSSDKLQELPSDEVESWIARQAEKHGITDPGEQDKIVTHLMDDPDMPWNLTLDPEFRALVYSPKGTRHIKGGQEENVAFVRVDDPDPERRDNYKWTEWVIGPSSTWKYKKAIVDKNQTRALDSLAKAKTGDVIPLTFRQDTTGGIEDTYRVTTR